jgi:hypothetical protein
LISASTLLTCSCLRGEQLGLGDELQPLRVAVAGGPVEAPGQRRHRDGVLLAAGLEVGQRLDRRRLDPVVAQQLEQALAAAGRLGDDQHPVRGRGQMGLQPPQRLGRAAVGAQVRQRAGPVDRPLAAHRELRVHVAQREEVLGLQEQVFRRQDGALRVVLQEAVALARVGPEALERFVDLAVQHQLRLLAQVLEDGGRLVEEQRQVVLDAGGGDPVADVLVDARLARVAFHALAPAGAESRARVLVHRELAPGQQAHLRHRVQAALAVRVEGADRIHFVTEQVHPVRHRRAHRVQVDQPAAHRVLARRDHLADVLVAGQRQLRLERGLVQLLLLLEVEGVGREEGGRCQAHQCG